jgi:hypothetical protein
MDEGPATKQNLRIQRRRGLVAMPPRRCMMREFVIIVV